MAVTDKPVSIENEKTDVAACEEQTAPPPLTNVEAETEPGAGMETEMVQQEIDFVTLGMFIIGRPSSHS